MKKGIILKLSMGVALAAAVAVCWMPAARAELSGGSDTFTYSQGANTLVMPFDLTGNHVSFEVASFTNVSSSYLGTVADVSDPVATHWSYWSDSCDHIRDVTICLTIGDTVVVDPTKLHGEIQSLNPPVNNPTTPEFNIGKVRGSVFVTAFLADTGAGGGGCSIDSTKTPIDNVLTGSWTIADTSTNAAFGANAIGINGVDGSGGANTSFDIDTLNAGGLKLSSFNPQSLGDTDVIILTVDSTTGFGSLDGFEWGPIRQPTGVCCDVEYQDNLEIITSHPEFCFACTGFAGIAPGVGGTATESGDQALLPPEINRPGVVHFFNCTTDDGAGTLDEIGVKSDQFLFGYHDQAVGQFGVTVSATYTGEAF